MGKDEATPEQFRIAMDGMESSEIGLTELRRRLASDTPPVVIDLRPSPEEDGGGFIEGSVSITMERLVADVVAQSVPTKSTPIVLVCAQSFSASRMVALTSCAYPNLRLLGYTQISILRDWSLLSSHV